MESFDNPEIPEKHLEFIKQVASLAAENGIQKVNFSYLPHWNTEPKWHESITGKISVDISTIDRRGRPAISIRVNMDSHLTINI